jgi:hypothetical protein
MPIGSLQRYGGRIGSLSRAIALSLSWVRFNENGCLIVGQIPMGTISASFNSDGCLIVGGIS